MSKKNFHIVQDSDGYISSDSAEELKKFHPEIVLYQPQIPQNTGSIARSCAAFSANLHLIAPMGFTITERALRRAGLDYWPYVSVSQHNSWEEFVVAHTQRRYVFVETGGTHTPSNFEFKPHDLIVFGAETFGLPIDAMTYAKKCVGESNVHTLTIPMFNRGVRSLNVSNTVSIVLYQSIMQLHNLNSQ